MSSDLDRMLRDARRALPLPDESATRRARGRALAAIRRRRLRRPAAVLLAAALVAVGVVIGALATPSGSAAPAPTGLGFLPAPGWSVLQNGGDGTAVRPAVAIAANVELSPDDDPDGLPLSTLETLPRDGVVIVASFIARGEAYYDRYFPARRLPLRAADAARGIEYGVQVRPDRPLGEYELKAAVNGHDVDLNFYYGTARPTASALAVAQRQLDRLVVSQPRTSVARPPVARALSSSPLAVSTTRLVNRTIECTPGSAHGARSITVSGQSGWKKNGKFEWLAQLSVTTPGQPLPRRRNYMPTLAGATAGYPFNGPIPTGSLGFEAKLCKPARATVPLTTRGLSGGAAGLFGGDQYTCLVSGPVLIHVRAAFLEPTTLKLDARRTFYTAIGRIAKAQIAVRTASGKALAYGEVLDSGKARIFTAKGCT
ncbi:MAG TPA: hypothetical protein VGQ15_12440 [Gaiellaceae bacterium]|nr:hypothetical protein [Gaiellaceae bacterium]